MKKFKNVLRALSIIVVAGLMFLPSSFAFATNMDKELTDREKAAFIVRNEWTTWVNAFTASLSELDKNATSRIYNNMDFYDMQYRFTEKYKKVPEYLDEDGKPTQKLKDLIKKKRKELNGATIIDPELLSFISKQDGSTIKYVLTSGFDESSIDIGWSYDGLTWTRWAPNESITPEQGKSLYIWNKKPTLSSDTAQFSFVMTGIFDTAGNIRSLLNFSDLTANCFNGLFKNCAALIQSPELPDTALKNACYYEMFYGCTGLTSMPNLPATTLADSCYHSMFYNCTSLSGTTTLPATLLKNECYKNMFYGCTNLKRSPAIMATSAANEACASMFNACTNLNELRVAYTGNWDVNNCFDNWVNGVDRDGIIYYSGTDFTYGPSAIPYDDTYKWGINGPSDMYLTFKAVEDSGATIAYTLGSSITKNNIYYKKNSESWVNWTVGTNIVLSKGDYVKIWNRDDTLSTSYTDAYRFKFRMSGGKVEASGNCNSMINFANLSNYAFSGLFSDCDTLTKAPKLPSTVLADYCYHTMFYSCDQLVQAPDLPATVLKQHCYNQMFRMCTNLLQSPKIAATTLAQSCFVNMFDSCSKLEKISLAYSGNFSGTGVPSGAFTTWVNGVSNTGEIEYAGTDFTYGSSALPKNDTYKWTVKMPPLNFTAIEDSTIKWTGKNITTIQYSVDNDNWQAFERNVPITLNAGDKIYVRNTVAYLSDSLNHVEFVMTGKIAAAGNVNSLLNESNVTGMYAYLKLFNDCTALTTAPVLPSTLVGNRAYCCMFMGCTNLVTPPKLPATTVDDCGYLNMFSGCTSLISAPELPATDIDDSSYCRMFQYCTSLTTAPSLPATNLGPNCYEDMFYGCTALTTAPPTLPAETLTKECYLRMFKGCTSLTTSPDIKATTVAEASCEQMFSGCTSLNKIKISYSGPFTGSSVPSNAFNYWVDYVSNSGTFIYPGTDRTYGHSAIPKDDSHKWTVSAS